MVAWRDWRIAVSDTHIPAAITIPALTVAAYEWAVFLTTFSHPGAIGIDFNAVGTDWMVFFSAARCFIENHLDTIFDGDRFTAYLNASLAHFLSKPLPLRPWVYPPSFLLLLLPFGYLGFAASCLLFQLLTAGGLAWVLGSSGDRPGRFTVLAALTSPAAAVTAISGQAAFLVALLMIAGLRLAEKRPNIAGILLALLTFKPQFFLLAPVALIAGRHWKCLSATIAAFLALLVLSTIVFGIGPWLWWLHQSFASIASPDPRWVEFGRMWGNSVWTCARLLGAPDSMASLLQLAALIGCGAAVFAAYRSSAGTDHKLAILLTAAMLAAPHSGAYDAILPVIAMAFWLTERAPNGGALWPWIPLLCVWMIPFFSPPAINLLGRLTPLFLLIFLIQASGGAAGDLAGSARRTRS